jgi:hypothetical protein
MSQNYQHGHLRQDANLDHIVGNFSGEKIMKPENEYAERQSLEPLGTDGSLSGSRLAFSRDTHDLRYFLKKWIRPQWAK